MKDRELPLLVFMVMKRNDDVKERGVANGSIQILCTDKSECASPNPDLCSLKNVCAVAAKEERDVETVDLPGFFLKNDEDKDEEPIIMELTGSVALLLVEMDEK